MIDQTPRDTPPDEDAVRIDGRAIPFQAWEHELMLRAAAWVAVVQGVAMAYVAGNRWMRWHLVMDAWPLASMIALVGIGWLCVQSRGARTTLVVTGVVFFLVLVLGGAWTSNSTYRWRLERVMPLASGLIYGSAGLLLLWRSALARDVLLVLGGAWLVVLGPPVLEDLSEWPSFGRSGTPVEVVAWLLPPAFVFLTLLSRAGRSLFVDEAAGARLAPFASIRQGPPTARGWASIVVVVLTLFGTAATLDTLERLVRNVW